MSNRCFKPIVATLAILAGIVIAVVLVPTSESRAKADSQEIAAAASVIAIAAVAEVRDDDMDWTDLHELAVAFDAAAYSLACATPYADIKGEVIAISDVYTSTGQRVPPGRRLSSPRLSQGIILTVGAGDLYVGTRYARDLAARELIAVGAANTTGTDACSTGCSVTCGPGFYACCNEGVIFADKCKCIANGTTPAPSCDHGGPGATGCSTAGSD